MQASIIEMPLQNEQPSATLESMFRLRHEVFKERLKWDVGSASGKEQDAFDNFDAVYIVCEEDGEVLGSCRLLPTTGPYMLKNVFPELLHGAPAPVAEDVWEISRFAVSKRVAGNDSLGTIRKVTNMLLEELFKFAKRRNVSRFVAVSDVRFEHILKRAGLLTTRFGPALQIGVTKAVSGFADVNELNIRRLELAKESTVSAEPNISPFVVDRLAA